MRGRRRRGLPRDRAARGEREHAACVRGRLQLERDFAGEFGDHRQELVFIGVRMDKAAITKAFDECLLTDAEMDAYRKHWT